MLPWDDATVWSSMKPSMPWGQLPCLTYKVRIKSLGEMTISYIQGEKICQSMAICRFVAREAGIGGRNSLEIAMVDEIVDVIQDAIEANVGAQKKNH